MQELSTFEAIAEHSAGLAAAAENNLGAAVEHCPGWSVADLVWHVTEVHHFWGTIVEQKLIKPPRREAAPHRVREEELIDRFRQGADWMVGVLLAADPDQHVWTWAPAQQDVAFISRHQVQEAAVHHWDAAHAAGQLLTIAPAVAADAITEFLTFSVSSDDDPASPPRPALEGSFGLRATDAGATWTVTDGAAGNVRFEEALADGVPAISATASSILLWLYGRVGLDSSGVQPELLERFRALTFTD